MNNPVGLLKKAAKSSVKRVIATLQDPMAAKPADAFLREGFKKYSDRYAAAGTDEKRKMSLQLLNKIAVDPAAGSLLDNPAYDRIFGKSDYYHHGRVAYAYSTGDVVRATEIAAELHDKSRTAFNAWLLGRCLRANDQKQEAIDHLKAAATLHPNEGDVVLEFASQLYWSGQASAANEALSMAPAGSIPFGDIDALKSELATAIKEKQTIRTGGGDIYDEQMVIDTWWRYWRYFNQLTEFQHNEPFVMNAILRRLSVAVEKTGPKTVIDFGALCGEINYRLALKFPDVAVHGVDRQEVIKRLNDEAYALPNLHFRDGDIFESLEALNEAPVLFTHTRTTVLCYPEFVQQLYDDCHKKGVQTIVGFEPSGISRETSKFPDYPSMERSVAFRTVMMLHDYPKMLEKAGYRITKSEFVPVSFLYWDDPGYHLFYFEAERI